MSGKSPFRFGSLRVLTLIAPAFLLAGSPCQTLPPAQPTTAAAPAVPARPANAIASPSQRAQVDFAGGKLTVTATNSSLNQILRDVSRLTGMKITGGVMDERVYGSYGPADPAAILTTLLNGTGSNVLIVEDKHQTAVELVLTPRMGGATPPNPNAGRDEERNDLPPQMTPRVSNEQSPQQFIPPPSPTQTSLPPGAPASTPPPSTPDAATPAAGGTTQQSPNGVKTPQQIYDQLMKLQQQQQKTPPQ